MRIIRVTFDDSRFSRPPHISAEREKTVSDLLADNSFRLTGLEGPYQMDLGLYDGRLQMGMTCTVSQGQETLQIPLIPFKRHIRDYGIICDNFDKTARAGEYHRLEAIDMGRRALHNEAAEMVIEALENKVILDKMTSRRLFSLIYVLHMRNIPTT